MRNDMEAAASVFVQSVVARSRPIPVAIDEDVIECEEPQGLVDIEDRTDLRLQLIGRSLVEDAAEIDEVFPRGRLFLRLELKPLLILRDVFSDVLKAAARAGI